MTQNGEDVKVGTHSPGTPEDKQIFLKDSQMEKAGFEENTMPKFEVKRCTKSSQGKVILKSHSLDAEQFSGEDTTPYQVHQRALSSTPEPTDTSGRYELSEEEDGPKRPAQRPRIYEIQQAKLRARSLVRDSPQLIKSDGKSVTHSLKKTGQEHTRTKRKTSSVERQKGKKAPISSTEVPRKLPQEKCSQNFSKSSALDNEVLENTVAYSSIQLVKSSHNPAMKETPKTTTNPDDV